MKKILFWGLILLLALEIVISNPGWVNYKLFLTQIISSLFLFLGVFGIISNKSSPVKSSLNTPILTYLLWIAVSFLFSPFKSSSVYGLYNVLLLATLYFFAVNSVTQKKELNLLISLWLLAGAFISTSSILHYKNETIIGSFGNPNLFAAFLVSTIPFSLFYLIKTEKKSVKLFCGLLFIILLLALYLTKSRGGCIAGIFSVLVFLFLWTNLTRRNNKILFKVTFSFLILVLLAGLIAHKKIAPLLNFQGREYIWQGAIRMIRERPFFGWGIGNFVIYFPQFSPGEIFQIYPDQFVNNAHNEFLTITAELGLIGLGIFLWLLFKIFILAKKNMKNTGHYYKTISVAAISSIAGVILINIFDVSLRFVFTAMFFWLAIAILAIVDNISITDTDSVLPKKSFPLFFRIGLVLISLYLSVNLAAYATHALWATKEYNKSSNSFSLNLNKIDSLIKEAEEKTKNNKLDARAYFQLGTIYARKMDWQNARNYLEKAINIDRCPIFAYNNLGNVYLNLGDIDKAISIYHKAVEILPGYLNAHYNLGFAYFKKIQLKDALREFDFVLNKNRNDFQAWQVRQLIFE